MDPVSLVAMASTAFKGVQVLVSKGAEIEHVAQKLGHFYTLASDFKEAQKEIESPPLFRKVFDNSSVEEQALNAIIAKKKIEEQEKQIRELIMYAYGEDTYREMMQMRRDIKTKREQVIYKQRRKQRRMLDVSAIIISLMVTAGIIWTTISVIQGVSNG